MRYWQLIEYLEKNRVNLQYKQGSMEAYNDVLFTINDRQVVIECCMNEFSVTEKNNFNLIGGSYDLSDFKTPKEVMDLLNDK